MSEGRIDVEMDLSSVINGTAKLLELTGKQKKALQDLIATTVHLNEEGEASSAYVEQQTNASQRLVSVIRNIGTANETTTRKIVATSQAIQRQRDAIQDLLNVNNRKAFGKTIGSTDYNTQELARIEKIRTAIGKLDTEVVTPEKIKEFFSSIKAGTIPEASGALAKLRDELVKLHNVQASAQVRLGREAAAGTGGLSDAELKRRAALRARNFQETYQNYFTTPIAANFGIDNDKLSLSQVTQIKRIGGNIAKIIRRSISEDPEKVVDNKSLRNLLPDLLSGKNLNFLNRPELQAASNEVGKLISLYERLKKQQDAIAASKAPKPVDPVKVASEAAARGRADVFRNNFESDFLRELESQFKISTTNLTRRQKGVLRNASANLVKSIAGSDSGLDQTTVRDLFDKIRAGGVVTAPEGSELARVASELTKVIGLYERLRQEKDRQARVNQNALDQRLKSDVESQRDEKRVQTIQERLRRALSPLQTQLKTISPDLDPDKNGKLSSMLRKIAELGQKVGLSSREVQALYDRLNSGALTAADNKYARLLDKLNRLNDVLNRAKGAANNFVTSNGGKGPPFPGAPKVSDYNGGLPPKPDDVNRAKEYSGIFQKIRDGLEYFLVYKGFNFISNQLQSAFDNARKFQIQISLIRTISQDAQVSFGELGRKLVSVSNKTGLDLNDVSQSAIDAIQNQVASAQDIEKFQTVAANLAKTTGSSLQDAVNLLSSSIRAYGHDIDDAEAISAKFFKAIDIGRIKAGDLANTYGRVAFTARELGVAEDEVISIIATLTQKGITADDAVTFLVNGMNKLTNPTEKASALLKQLGFESPRAAVGIKGFAGTMAILTEAVKAGKLELTDLFNEIRGEKFASAYKTFQGEIQKNTQTISKDSLATYRRAIDIRNESPAEQINKQINELKNTLTQSFGNELTQLLKGLIDASGGVEKLAGSINTVTKLAIIGGGAFLTYKAVILGVQSATAALNGVMLASTALRIRDTAAANGHAIAEARDTAAKTTNTVATATNTAVMRQNAAAYIAHPIGLFVAAGAALYAYWQTQNLEVGKYNEKLQTLNDTYEEIIKKQKEVAQENVFEKYQQDIAKAETQLKRVGENIATDLAAANRQLEISKERATSTASALKEGFEKYVNYMKDRISDVSREYNKFDDRIKASAKSILDFRDIIRQNVLEKSLKYSGGFEFDQFRQREKLITEEMKRVKEQIKQLYTVGSDAKLGPTDEDLQKARELAKTYLGLNKQRDEVREERKQKQFEEGVKERPELYRPDKYGKVYRSVDVRPFEKEQKEIGDFLEDLEKKAQARAKDQHDKDEQNILTQKEALLKAENAIKELDNIKIFDKGGDVLPEFKDKLNGRADISKVKEVFKKTADAAKAKLDPKAREKLGPQIDEFIKKRIEALGDEIRATEAVNALAKKQQQANEAVKTLNQSFKDGRDDIRKYGSEIEAVAKQLDGLVEGLKTYGGDSLEALVAQGLQGKRGIGNGTAAQRAANRALEFLDSQTGISSGVESIFGGDAFGRNTAKGQEKQKTSREVAKERLQPIRDEANAIQQELLKLKDKTITKDGISILDPEAVKAILARIKALKEKVKEELREAVGNDQVALNGVKSIPELDVIEAGLEKSLKGSADKYNDAVNNLNKLRESTNLISGDLSTTLDKLNAIGPAASQAAGGAAKPIQSLSGDIQKLNAQVDSLLGKFSQLKLSGKEEQPAIPAIPTAPPKDAFEPGKALGGMLYYAGGGPVGSDNRLVYGQAGEYIWNRTATRQYYSQIQAMNGRGRTPIEFHTTTGDTINVGGVTINESKSGQTTASDMMRAIRRNQRRG